MNTLMCVLGVIATTTYPVATPSSPPYPTRATQPVTELIEVWSKRWGVDPAVMTKVIECESGFQVRAVGDNGTSFGLAQIHLPAHPHVDREDAFDPSFAVRFMAREMAAGNAWKWTCFKKIYTNTLSTQ